MTSPDASKNNDDGGCSTRSRRRRDGDVSVFDDRPTRFASSPLLRVNANSGMMIDDTVDLMLQRKLK